MSKCYYCNGVGYCDHCRKKATPSPNEVKAPIVTAAKIKPTKPKMYGFISRQCMADGHGTAWYKRPDGSFVEICWVSEDINGGEHGWTDYKSVGEVTEWAQKGLPAKHERVKQPITQRY